MTDEFITSTNIFKSINDQKKKRENFQVNLILTGILLFSKNENTKKFIYQHFIKGKFRVKSVAATLYCLLKEQHRMKLCHTYMKNINDRTRFYFRQSSRPVYQFIILALRKMLGEDLYSMQLLDEMPDVEMPQRIYVSPSSSRGLVHN